MEDKKPSCNRDLGASDGLVFKELRFELTLFKFVFENSGKLSQLEVKIDLKLLKLYT